MKILLIKRHKSYRRVYRITEAIADRSQHYNVDHDLIIALMYVESDFKPGAKSGPGARGLMQVMPFWTSKKQCYKKNLWNIEQNIDCGIQIYLYYLEKYKTQKLALCAYNQGSGLLNKALRLKQNPDNGYAKNVTKYFKRLKRVNKYRDMFAIAPLYRK